MISRVGVLLRRYSQTILTHLKRGERSVGTNSRDLIRDPGYNCRINGPVKGLYRLIWFTIPALRQAVNLPIISMVGWREIRRFQGAQMADKIRLGIIGANIHRGWAPRAHLPAVVASPEFELTAVCTTRQESADEARQKFGA